MSLFRRIVLSCLAAALIFGFTACQKEGPIEKAGKKADQTVEEGKEKAGEAADAIKKKTE